MSQNGEVITALCEFEWKIPDFNLNSKEGYISHPISCAGTSWCMSICPNGLPEYSSVGYTGLYLMGLSPDSSVSLQICFEIKNADEKIDEKRYPDRVPLAKGYVVYGIHKLFPRDELTERASNLLPSNTLTIICSVKPSKHKVNGARNCDNPTVCGLTWEDCSYVAYLCRTCQLDKTMMLCPDCFRRGNHKGHDILKFRFAPGGSCNCGDEKFLKKSGFCDRHGSERKINKPGDLPDPSAAEKHIPHLFSRQIQNLRDNSESIDVSLSPDLKKMLSEGIKHDVILKIGDKELRAHQDILRARSHVFQSMLDHDMKEKKTGEIKINDCDPQAMKVFLSYVYTGKVEDLDESNMFGAYYIADKYDMQNLKDRCCDFIKMYISNTNICQAIQLAMDHSDSKLLEYATEYFLKNALEIILTVEWQTFLKDNTTVGNELIVKSFQKLKNTKS